MMCAMPGKPSQTAGAQSLPAMAGRFASPLAPKTGLGVLHLFYRVHISADFGVIRTAVEAACKDGCQVVSIAMLGHKADLGFMVLADDMWHLRAFQTRASEAGLELSGSYVSITEVSEYAPGLPEDIKSKRLYPSLPPDGKRAFCFYPMSKRRQPGQNWYTLDYEQRRDLMYAHGATGRKFAGRVLQLVTGSAGVDDFEWGVSLFANRPDDLKDVVYTMRFDEASALYAEFGPFFFGVVADLEEVLSAMPGAMSAQR
jgi:chlorite dismutase